MNLAHISEPRKKKKKRWVKLFSRRYTPDAIVRTDRWSFCIPFTRESRHFQKREPESLNSPPLLHRARRTYFIAYDIPFTTGRITRRFRISRGHLHLHTRCGRIEIRRERYKKLLDPFL